MSDIEDSLYAVLIDTILPNLNRVQASQAEQRLQGDQLNRNLEEFRAEMQKRFAELRADLAATRHQFDVAVAALRESEARFVAAMGLAHNPIVH